MSVTYAKSFEDGRFYLDNPEVERPSLSDDEDDQTPPVDKTPPRGRTPPPSQGGGGSSHD